MRPQRRSLARAGQRQAELDAAVLEYLLARPGATGGEVLAGLGRSSERIFRTLTRLQADCRVSGSEDHWRYRAYRVTESGARSYLAAAAREARLPDSPREALGGRQAASQGADVPMEGRDAPDASSGRLAAPPASVPGFAPDGPATAPAAPVSARQPADGAQGGQTPASPADDRQADRVLAARLRALQRIAQAEPSPPEPDVIEGALRTVHIRLGPNTLRLIESGYEMALTGGEYQALALAVAVDLTEAPFTPPRREPARGITNLPLPAQPEAEEMFGVPGCTCRPFTRHGGTPRYLGPKETVDKVSGWEPGRDCPHHEPRH